MRILLLPHLIRKGTHMRENEKRKTRDEEKNEKLIGAVFYATHSVFHTVAARSATPAPPPPPPPPAAAAAAAATMAGKAWPSH